MTLDSFHFSSQCSSIKESEKKSRKNKSSKKPAVYSIVTESEEVENLTESDKVVEKRRKRKKQSTTESSDVPEEGPQEKPKEKKKKKNINKEDAGEAGSQKIMPGTFHFSNLYSSITKSERKFQKKNSSQKFAIDSIVTESEEVDNFAGSNKIIEKHYKSKKEPTTKSLDVSEETSKLQEKPKKKNINEHDPVEANTKVKPHVQKVSTCSYSETQLIQEHIIKPSIPNTNLTKKKKGRKSKKGRTGVVVTEEDRESCVLVEDLPLSVLLSYKFLLTKHFSKCGLNVKNVGAAEVYPAAEPRTVFTTCVQFDSPSAAQRALLEDGARVKGVKGARIHVQPVSAMTVTTVVVRCRNGCAPGLLSSVFAPCGRVRVIREIIKGNNSTPIAFVEFSESEGVERALAAAKEARIGGAKVHVSRYEERGKRTDHQSDAGDKQSSEEIFL